MSLRFRYSFPLSFSFSTRPGITGLLYITLFGSDDMRTARSKHVLDHDQPEGPREKRHRSIEPLEGIENWSAPVFCSHALLASELLDAILSDPGGAQPLQMEGKENFRQFSARFQFTSLSGLGWTHTVLTS